MPLTLKFISDRLGLSRWRVDQWISRRHFRTPDRPLLGKPREWSLADAMRLALMSELVDAGLSAETAGALTQFGLHGFKDDVAYFVAWQGPVESAIRPDGPDAPGLKILMPGHWNPSDIIGGRKLNEFLANPDHRLSVVVNLDVLSERVSAALDETA